MPSVDTTDVNALDRIAGMLFNITMASMHPRYQESPPRRCACENLVKEALSGGLDKFVQEKFVDGHGHINLDRQIGIMLFWRQEGDQWSFRIGGDEFEHYPIFVAHVESEIVRMGFSVLRQ